MTPHYPTLLANILYAWELYQHGFQREVWYTILINGEEDGSGL